MSSEKRINDYFEKEYKLLLQKKYNKDDVNNEYKNNIDEIHNKITDDLIYNRIGKDNDPKQLNFILDSDDK